MIFFLTIQEPIKNDPLTPQSIAEVLFAINISDDCNYRGSTSSGRNRVRNEKKIKKISTHHHSQH